MCKEKNIGSPYHFPKNTMLYIINKCFVSSTSVPLFMLLFFLKQFFAEMRLTLVHSLYPPTQLNYYKTNTTLKYFVCGWRVFLVAHGPALPSILVASSTLTEFGSLVCGPAIFVLVSPGDSYAQ